uniref:Uncharacterized protein n=1 Tax=Arundo donax TaxID=35708 RepID=A0A0A9AWC9_ARUDO
MTSIRQGTFPQSTLTGNTPVLLILPQLLKGQLSEPYL